MTFYRSDLPDRAINLLGVLTGRLDEKLMQELNASVVLDGKTHAEAARIFLVNEKLIYSGQLDQQSDFWSDMLSKTVTHLKITFISLFAAIIIAIPLGILVYWFGSLAKPVLYISGLLQTIPSIALLAGIKTAAVIIIGTATLAAFIGAGGLGEYIVTGLALNNTGLILQGAIPAALLAILVEFLFELLEKFVVPKHLRQKMVK